MKTMTHMRKFGWMLVVVCGLTTSLSAKEKEATDAAVEAVKTYRKALEVGELKSVVFSIANFQGYPQGMVEEKQKRLIGLVREGRLNLWIFPQASKAVGDFAVVTVGDGEEPAPDDPFYLIRRDGEWKILPSLTRWKDEQLNLTEAQETALSGLEKFHDQMRKELRNMQDVGVE